MMAHKEYMAVKGINYYLIDLNSNEGYKFSEYGKGLEALEAKYVVSICNVLREVDIFSILYSSCSSRCEIYYKGKKAIIQDKGINVYRRIPTSFQRENIITFRITRTEEQGVSQILIPFKEGTVSYDMLESVFGKLNWVEV